MDATIEQMIFETERRIQWYIDGIGIHCLSPELFLGLTTKRITELYNVEMNYFT